MGFMSAHLKRNALAYLLIAISCGLSAHYSSIVPPYLTTQWNLSGLPALRLPKLAVICGLPAFAVVVIVLLDLQAKNQVLSNQRVFQFAGVLAAVILLCIQWFILSANSGQMITSPARVVHLVFAISLIAMGNYMGKLQPNRYAGFRTPWTLASDENWFHTHRFASRLMLLSGLLVLGAGFAVPAGMPFIILLAVGFGVPIILPVFYSYLISR